MPFSCEHNIHLWTIEDAMDGDVLVSIDNHPFIYTGKSTTHTINAYCGFDEHNSFIANRYWEYKNDNIRPATKEQQDLLFQRIKEDGYEWNADIKVLNKVIIYESKN